MDEYSLKNEVGLIIKCFSWMVNYQTIWCKWLLHNFWSFSKRM